VRSQLTTWKVCESSSAPCQSVTSWDLGSMHMQWTITSWAKAENYTWIWITVSRNSCNTALRSWSLKISYSWSHTRWRTRSLRRHRRLGNPKGFTSSKQLAEGFSMDEYELPWLKLRIRTLKILYGVRSHSQAIACYKLIYKEDSNVGG